MSNRDELIRLCVDADCPKCGWPETWYETTNPPAAGGLSGCNKCDYRRRHAVHTVTIEPGPKIRFECSGDETSACRNYPDCDCEEWELTDHKHPNQTHQECWLQAWFDNDCVGPTSDMIGDVDYTVGMSGPIATSFEGDYIEWEFEDEQAAALRTAANRAEAQP